MNDKNTENLQPVPEAPESDNKSKFDNLKLFIGKNKKILFVFVAVIIVVVYLLGTKLYTADINYKNTEISPTPTSLPSITPTTVPIAMPTKTKIPVQTSTPSISSTPTSTPAPTVEPIDSTKGAIRIKLLDYDSKQPLPDVSNVNTLIKSGDFSSTKSGAEVYFYNLSVGQTYEVYVDNPPGYTHRASICGSDCQAFGGQQCLRKLPAKIPSENQEIQCLYSKN